MNEEENTPGFEGRYYYKLERITHRDLEEDKVTTLEVIRHTDLWTARKRATEVFREELEWLKKITAEKSPGCNSNRGRSFSVFLLLIDSLQQETYIVETNLKEMLSAIKEQRKKEKKVFKSLGLDYPFDSTEREVDDKL